MKKCVPRRKLCDVKQEQANHTLYIYYSICGCDIVVYYPIFLSGREWWEWVRKGEKEKNTRPYENHYGNCCAWSRYKLFVYSVWEQSNNTNPFGHVKNGNKKRFIILPLWLFLLSSFYFFFLCFLIRQFFIFHSSPRLIRHNFMMIIYLICIAC